MTPTELRDRMAALPEPVTDLKPPYWQYWRWHLWDYVVRQEKDPFGFMGWPCVYHTMCHRHWPHVIESEFHEVSLWTSQATISGERWRHAMGPLDQRFQPNDNVIVKNHTSPVSQAMIHQAYHLFKLMVHGDGGRPHIDVSGLNSIVEFGGGFGAMALVCRRLGFKGTYTIIDLPEFLLLQQLFLSNSLPELTDTYFLANPKDATWPIVGSRLFIAGYSLSEVPVNERDDILRAWPANNYLLWYSNRFVDYDNVAYFQEHVPALLLDYEWLHWRIEHMPPESHYSIGWRK